MKCCIFVLHMPYKCGVIDDLGIKFVVPLFYHIYVEDVAQYTPMAYLNFFMRRNCGIYLCPRHKPRSIIGNKHVTVINFIGTNMSSQLYRLVYCYFVSLFCVTIVNVQTLDVESEVNFIFQVFSELKHSTLATQHVIRCLCTVSSPTCKNYMDEILIFFT